jgi:hypothetical protein
MRAQGPLRRGLRAYATHQGHRCRACGVRSDVSPYCSARCQAIADEFNSKHGRLRFATRQWRRFILERDGWRCQYCGKQVDWRSSQIDHLLPYYHEGRTLLHNLVTACRECNQLKQAGVFTKETYLFVRNGICLADLPPRYQRRLLKAVVAQRGRGYVGVTDRWRQRH